MKTRENIHQKLNNLFFSELANNLSEPLIKKISCINKGNFNNRFDLRVAADESQLGNWWRHPIYVIAKPSAENVIINITIQPQRWPGDGEKYANDHKDSIDKTNQEINDLIKSHSINAPLVKKDIKTEGKFVLSYTLSVTIDKANPTDADYSKFINFLASLCQITASLSDALPIGEATSTGESTAEEEKNDEDEDDDIGFALMNIVKSDSVSGDVQKKYFTKWQKASETYNGRMGISCLVPEEANFLADDTVFPVLTLKELSFIENQITKNKVIPVLGFLPQSFLDYSKHIWFIIPFCIWNDDTATVIFVDKNGLYTVDPTAEQFIMLINWESIESMELETAIDGDANVSRLYITAEKGELSIDEFNTSNNESEFGSYLSILMAIFNVRQPTIIESKGKDFWVEGAGGEGFVSFNSLKELSSNDKWLNASRPDPAEFRIEETTDNSDEEEQAFLDGKEAVLSDTLTSLAFLYIATAGADNDLHDEEFMTVNKALAEWTKGGDIGDAAKTAFTFWKSLPSDKEIIVVTEIINQINNNLSAEHITSIKEDIVKIVDADGELLEDEKNIVAFIFTSLK
jgi:hypothetical protein